MANNMIYGINRDKIVIHGSPYIVLFTCKIHVPANYTHITK